MIIDTHVHTGIFEDIDRIVNMSEEIVMEAMELYNIDMAVVSNAAAFSAIAFTAVVREVALVL